MIVELFELFGQVTDADTEIAAFDTSRFNQALGDVFGHIDFNGKTDTVVTAASGNNGGVDTDKRPAAVHQCAAGISGIDGGVGLDKILILVDTDSYNFV